MTKNGDGETVYIVVEDFTDTYGRAWIEGEEFVVMEDPTVTQAALEAGQIEESTPAEIAKAKADKAKAEAEAKVAAEKAKKEEADKAAAEEKAKIDKTAKVRTEAEAKAAAAKSAVDKAAAEAKAKAATEKPKEERSFFGGKK